MVMTRQQTRHALLSKVCSQLPDTQRSTAQNWSDLLVNKQRKYVYCKVGKVSNTSWKRTLLELTGLVSNATHIRFNLVHSRRTSRHLLPFQWYNVKPDEIELRLQTYYKFFFVREPFERLVSAYRDKILRDRSYKKLRKQFMLHQQKSDRNELVEFMVRIIAPLLFQNRSLYPVE